MATVQLTGSATLEVVWGVPSGAQGQKLLKKLPLCSTVQGPALNQASKQEGSVMLCYHSYF